MRARSRRRAADRIGIHALIHIECTSNRVNKRVPASDERFEKINISVVREVNSEQGLDVELTRRKHTRGGEVDVLVELIEHHAREKELRQARRRSGCSVVMQLTFESLRAANRDRDTEMCAGRSALASMKFQKHSTSLSSQKKYCSSSRSRWFFHLTKNLTEWRIVVTSERCAGTICGSSGRNCADGHGEMSCSQKFIAGRAERNIPRAESERGRLG